MSYDHLCGPQKQPCPTPWLCRAECNLLRETPHDKAVRHFWEPGQPLNIEAYDRPSRLIRALDWVGNAWDDLNELGKICAVVCGVALCFVAAVSFVEFTK